jgi:prepilin-type N-terminal cleavage/methylation domain-containing protein
MIARTRGFTVIELLVVVVIIALLMVMLLPALSASRKAARRTLSANNLREIGKALTNYEAAKGHFPPSWQEPEFADGNNVNGWSIHSLLLPYLEEEKIVKRIDFKRSYTDYTSGGAGGGVVTADNTASNLSAMRVSVFVSPDEPRDEPRLENGEPTHYPLNYAANLGTFFVWDPATGEVGNGAFGPGRGFSAASVTDGLSHTIAFAEVRAWQPYGRNNGHDASESHISDIFAAVSPDANGALDAPADVADIEALVQEADGAGNFKSNSGHTEWVDGRAHQIGFTTVFGPNERVLADVKGDGKLVDVDWTNWQEGKNRASGAEHPTFAAVTARSYREEGVLVLLLGGSVNLVSPEINIGAWRAYSSRNGDELIANDQQIR